MKLGSPDKVAIGRESSLWRHCRCLSAANLPFSQPKIFVQFSVVYPMVPTQFPLSWVAWAMPGQHSLRAVEPSIANLGSKAF